MNKYELALVLSPSMEEEARNAEMTRIQEMIARFEGTVEKVDDWGKRMLAYPIKKVNEGYFSFTTFAAPATTPAELESRLRIMENVLRYLIVRVDG